jgi:hypothetical protein
VSWKWQRVLFSDFDGDEKNEVLVSLPYEDFIDQIIGFYDYDGSLLWEKKLTLFQEYMDEDLVPGPFKISYVLLQNIIGDEKPEILVIWTHNVRFPGVFAVYDHTGRELFRYINTGHLYRIWFYEDYLKNKYIFLNGTNNLLDGDGIMAVLDCQNLSNGIFPPYSLPEGLKDKKDELEKYIPLNPNPAIFKYYIRFPRNVLCYKNNRKWIHPELNFLQKDMYQVSVCYSLPNAKLFFSLDFQFRLVSLLPNADFEREWSRRYSRAEIFQSLEEFIANGERTMQFWDESGWEVQPFDEKN